MRIMLNAGSLDGQSLIEMNNLAVGYFPTESLEVGVYPPPVPQSPSQQLDLQPAVQPVTPATPGQ